MNIGQKLKLIKVDGKIDEKEDEKQVGKHDGNLQAKVEVPRKGNERWIRDPTRDKLLAPDVAVKSVMANGIDELELTTSYQTNLEDTPRSAEYTEKTSGAIARLVAVPYLFSFFRLEIQRPFPHLFDLGNICYTVTV
jgi:hypothetical protein